MDVTRPMRSTFNRKNDALTPFVWQKATRICRAVHKMKEWLVQKQLYHFSLLKAINFLKDVKKKKIFGNPEKRH